VSGTVRGAATGCGEPIADEQLLDWWAGEPVTDRRRVEEHLLGCTACSARLEVLQRIAAGVAALFRGGELPVVVAPAVLDRLRAEGLRIREYAVPAGGGVPCTITPEDDLLLARLGVDLRDVSRLDLVWRLEGTPDDGTARLRELPFDPRARELLLVPPVALIRRRPDHVETLALVSVDAEGGERELGRYEFHHTAWRGALR
jgi:hypothetical protein